MPQAPGRGWRQEAETGKRGAHRSLRSRPLLWARDRRRKQALRPQQRFFSIPSPRVRTSGASSRRFSNHGSRERCKENFGIKTEFCLTNYTDGHGLKTQDHKHFSQNCGERKTGEWNPHPSAISAASCERAVDLALRTLCLCVFVVHNSGNPEDFLDRRVAGEDGSEAGGSPGDQSLGQGRCRRSTSEAPDTIGGVAEFIWFPHPSIKPTGPGYLFD